MATNLYESFTHSITGETFTCLSFNKESYTMEWVVQPQGYVPFEHIHYYQDEIFYIKKGSLKFLISGKEVTAGPGETIIIPKGTSHIAENYLNETVECKVEYKPGLDYYTFFQCFIGLLKDKEYDNKGRVNIPKMAYFMYKTKCNAMARPTFIPAPVFSFMMVFFGFVGSLLGWEKQLKKYIE